MSSGKILLSVLAGAATGALLGILFAPDKGEATRRKITKKGEDYADGLKDKFSEFVDSIADNVNLGTAKDLIEAGKSTFDGASNPTEGSQRRGGHLKTSM